MQPASNDLHHGPLAIVGGCGHVGLPLGLAFARKGYPVDLLDTSPDKVAMVNSGRMPFHEDDAAGLLVQSIQSGLIRATTDAAVLEEAAALIVTIDTPVDEYLDPSVCEFDRSMTQLLAKVRPGQLRQRISGGLSHHGFVVEQLHHVLMRPFRQAQICGLM